MEFIQSQQSLKITHWCSKLVELVHLPMLCCWLGA